MISALLNISTSLHTKFIPDEYVIAYRVLKPENSSCHVIEHPSTKSSFTTSNFPLVLTSVSNCSDSSSKNPICSFSIKILLSAECTITHNTLYHTIVENASKYIKIIQKLLFLYRFLYTNNTLPIKQGVLLQSFTPSLRR